MRRTEPASPLTMSIASTASIILLRAPRGAELDGWNVAPKGSLVAFCFPEIEDEFGEILSFVGYAMMSDLLPVWGNALVPVSITRSVARQQVGIAEAGS
jgi:hypothetical protein